MPISTESVLLHYTTKDQGAAKRLDPRMEWIVVLTNLYQCKTVRALQCLLLIDAFRPSWFLLLVSPARRSERVWFARQFSCIVTVALARTKPATYSLFAGIDDTYTSKSITHERVHALIACLRFINGHLLTDPTSAQKQPFGNRHVFIPNYPYRCVRKKVEKRIPAKFYLVSAPAPFL